eukprot:2816585-Pleurochrysis_carterae.AAC.3
MWPLPHPRALNGAPASEAALQRARQTLVRRPVLAQHSRPIEASTPVVLTLEDSVSMRDGCIPRRQRFRKFDSRLTKAAAVVAHAFAKEC